MKLSKDESKEATVGRKQEQPKRPRFQIVKLEDRIAPACHTNPHGKRVGCGGHSKYY